MPRVLEHRAARTDLDDLSEEHDGDAMTHSLDDRHVVRNEKVGEAELRLQVKQQVDDLRLDRHVERRDGFVGNDDFRVERERARDGDPLPLATGELVRITLCVVRRESDVLQKPRDPLFGLASLRDAMHVERLGDRESDGEARIERGKRILEDHLDVAPDRPDLGGRQARNVAAAEFDASTRDIDEAQQ